MSTRAGTPAQTRLQCANEARTVLVKNAYSEKTLAYNVTLVHVCCVTVVHVFCAKWRQLRGAWRGEFPSHSPTTSHPFQCPTDLSLTSMLRIPPLCHPRPLSLTKGQSLLSRVSAFLYSCTALYLALALTLAYRPRRKTTSRAKNRGRQSPSSKSSETEFLDFIGSFQFVTINAATHLLSLFQPQLKSWILPPPILLPPQPPAPATPGPGLREIVVSGRLGLELSTHLRIMPPQLLGMKPGSAQSAECKNGLCKVLVVIFCSFSAH